MYWKTPWWQHALAYPDESCAGTPKQIMGTDERTAVLTPLPEAIEEEEMNKADSHDKFLMTHEAADLLRLSVRTLERMRVEGTGPRFLKAGPGLRARVLYRRPDLIDWLENNTYGSTSEYRSP